MDKIRAFSFEFNNGIMFCVGADWAIQDLYNHFVIQRDKSRSVEFPIWCQRIIKNKVYCRFELKNIQGVIVGLRFLIAMKKAGLWIKGHEYIEALLLANPEKVSRLLHLTSGEFEFTKRNTIWKDRFRF